MSIPSTCPGFVCCDSSRDADLQEVVIVPSLLVGQKKSSACFFHHLYQVYDVKFMAREEVLDLGKVLTAAIYGFATPCIRLPCVTQDVNGQK